MARPKGSKNKVVKDDVDVKDDVIEEIENEIEKKSPNRCGCERKGLVGQPIEKLEDDKEDE